MEYLLRTDLTFRQMLAKLYQELSIEKCDPLMEQLDIAAKYELIRMKGEGLLRFDDKVICLSEQGKDSLNLISHLRQVG
ncbi:MAG: hypothetical protein RIF33_01620 [Cyclobacteriaceae bacterium]